VIYVILEDIAIHRQLSVFHVFKGHIAHFRKDHLTALIVQLEDSLHNLVSRVALPAKEENMEISLDKLPVLHVLRGVGMTRKMQLAAFSALLVNQHRCLIVLIVMIVYLVELQFPREQLTVSNARVEDILLIQLYVLTALQEQQLHSLDQQDVKIVQKEHMLHLIVLSIVFPANRDVLNFIQV